MKPILVWPHPALSTPCTPAVPGQLLDRLIEELVDTLERTPRAAGLAAPQIGSTQRVVVIARNGEEPLVLINPQGVRQEGRWADGWEECLSLPGVKSQVSRPTNITLAYQVVVGGQLHFRTASFTDFQARVVAHELDHLEGKTILDYMSRQVRRAAVRTLCKTPPKHPPILKNPAGVLIDG